jgi:hypothetical protein
MKTSSWIKLIGILCVIFGASGIINDSVSILFPELIGMVKEKAPEVSPDPLRWALMLPYITLTVNIIYLMAGIIYLMKKAFSLKIMYIALTLSIFCRIVPMLFFSQYSSIPFSNYEINIFSLLGPIIDVSLLIGVFRLAKYYFKPDDELIKPFGEYTLTPRLLKLLTFLGLIWVSIPILIQGLWIYAASSGINQVERLTTFNRSLPDFLHSGYATNYLSIVFSILAIISSIINLKSSGIIWKANMIILVISSLLLLLNLFQMM